MESSKHVRFLERFLDVIPSSLEDLDSNGMAILYFCVCGISLLEDMPKKKVCINHIYRHLHASKRGFRGSLIYTLESSQYDPPNLSATFFALSVLLTLDEDITKSINRKALMEYVISCQAQDGSFRPFVDGEGTPFGDSDLRYCLIAASIRKILYFSEPPPCGIDIDLDKLERYIHSTVAYDGGLSGSKLGESHAGLTFCGLTALSLIGRLEGKNWDKTVDWLLHRQAEGDGGFNGRLNKPSDSCYCFWAVGSLKLFNTEADTEAVKRFLLQDCQNKMVGGFTKTAQESQPDPYHTFLSLATLSMLDNNFNSELVLSNRSVEFLQQLEWN